jgi:hypothetical protein
VREKHGSFTGAARRRNCGSQVSSFCKAYRQFFVDVGAVSAYALFARSAKSMAEEGVLIAHLGNAA